MKRSLIFFASLLSATLALQAGVRSYSVTPSTLNGWEVTGTRKAELQKEEILTLPAGSELVQTFTGGNVLLYSVSSPVFGVESVDWPIIQVGPLAVALTREGNLGRVVLLNDDKATELEVAVALDKDGRSVEPLEIALGIDPTRRIGVIAFADQLLSFATNDGKTSVEVAIAAGADEAWAQDTLEVAVVGTDIDKDLTKRGDTDEQKKAALLQAAADKLKHSGPIGGASPSKAGAPTEQPDLEAPTRKSSRLEIYTPPAVRQGAAAIRATIAKSRNK